MRCVRTRLTAVLITAAATSLTLGAAGASAASPDPPNGTAAANGVPTQQASETPQQYVQHLRAMGFTGWLIPKKHGR